MPRLRRWTVFPRFHTDFVAAERSSGQFLRFHVPGIVALAAVFWIPAVARSSGMPPLAVTLVLAIQLVQGAVAMWTRAIVRWPIGYGLVAITTNHIVGVALIALTSDPHTPMWGIYPAYPLLLAFAITLSVYYVALVVLSPLLVALVWAGLGAAPLSSSLGTAALSSLVTTMIYLLISSGYQAVRDERTRNLQELATKAEQLRIASDLHSGVGAALTEIALWQGIAAAGGGDIARDALERAVMRTRDALTTLRSCVNTLTHEQFDAATIERQLRIRVGELCRSAGVDVRCTFHCPAVSVSAVVAYHVSKLVDEALVNAIRHARASSITINVTLGPSIAVEVMDDGTGFDPATTVCGHGMSSLRVHARALGHELSITSSPEAGTRVGLGERGQPPLAQRAAP